MLNDGQKFINDAINQLNQYVDHVWVQEEKYLANLKNSLIEFNEEVETVEAKQKQIQECLRSLPNIN